MQGDTTTGEWVTEAETLVRFDEAMVRLSRYFVVRKQVRGFLLRPRLGQDVKGYLRIDRLLEPTGELIDAGWTIGPVGVECKRPGVAIGPPIAQMIDYANCVFDIGDGYWISPQWFFLFHHEQPSGPIASVLSQHRLGGISFHERDGGVFFTTGQSALARFSPTGEILRMGEGKNGFARGGQKVGSR